ncbi:LysM peptidoglycan-binding domain-containing protein [Actibacterium pelagium]|nr:LysM peptidoglycan-binding domain-containing protein [Actibacterium pelagium]
MTIKTMTKSILAGVGLAAALPVAAAAQQACGDYTVQAGDSLGSIAAAAYGSFDYQAIFNANRDVLGGNPNNLAPGMVLAMPCADDLNGASLAINVVPENSGSSAAGYNPPIKLLTGSGWAPFSEEKLTGGGFLPRLATTALRRGGNDRDFSLAYVEDLGAHLDVLLPSGAFDISLGWYMPDCNKMNVLSPTSKRQCNEFDASVPVYETVMGYYTKVGSAYEEAVEFRDFTGARFCRVESQLTFDLEEEGLQPPLVTLVRPKTAEDCFEELMRGGVDVVGIEVQSAAAVINELQIEDEVIDNPNLSKVLSMSFLAHKSNPFGRQYILMMNRGLNEMRETGEWFQIISSSLAEYNQQLVTN